MRILYLAPVDLSEDGGRTSHVRGLCAALERRGHDVRLIAHRMAGEPRVPAPRGGLVLAGGPAVVRVPRVRHLVSEWALARALRREASRYRPDLLLVRQEALTMAPWLAGLTRRPRKFPLVVESNSSLPAIARSAGASRGRAARLASWEGRLLRAADAAGVVTAALSRRHLDAYGLEDGRLFVVPNGAWIPPPIGDEAGRVRREHGVGDAEFLISFAGNMNPVQGLDLLLEVLAREDLAVARGWIIGDAPERPAWKHRARELGARVDFLGGMSEAETARRLGASQLVVAPYHAEDYARIVGGPSSLKVLTALACDRPLLVSDLDGLEPLRGIASITFAPAGDPGAWAGAIRRLVTDWEGAGRPLRDWPWREGDGPGRTYIEAGHTWDHTAEAWEAAFLRAIDVTKRRSR